MRIITLFPLLLLVSWSAHLIDVSKPRLSPAQKRELEVLYLPGGDILSVLSFGYRNVLADVLWFNTVSYFGKHYSSDHDYRWLAHMCELVTTLSPSAQHVYEFCSLMLAWEVHAPESSIALLTKAVENNPKNWKYYYLRGFNYMFFLDDLQRAKDDFVMAAKLPGVHPVVSRIAAKKLSQLEDPAQGIEFLEDVLSRTEDPAARSALEARLHELQAEHAASPSGD